MQIDLVVETFALVLKQRQDAGMLFYKRLFAVAPELRPLFRSDLQVQSRKLMETLGGAIESLRDTPALRRNLRELGARHRGYGVRAEHYPLVGEALISTLAQALGDAFTPPVRRAWIVLYRDVSSMMNEPPGGSAVAGVAAPQAASA